MGKIIIDEAFWDVFPGAQLNVLVITNIQNQCSKEKQAYFAELLKDASNEAKQYLTNETFSKNTVIDEWRKAFSQFKTKKGARSSIEALLKRVNQDRAFTPINPLVDIYNSISLKYAVPCGGEDLQLISGDLHLGKAKGGESFLPLGADQDAPALPEEIIYYDNEGAICRCLNWREAQRTMLTEETTDAVLVIESINEDQALRAEQAMEEMKVLMNSFFQTECVITTLSKDNSCFEY
ncbi:tRNA synthetase subunit beta [Bacillus sp. FJAT-27916]|uniref:B3/B4 domain-containing protein n=1 Tax=Bacillaceae TaxID=186817 RepID=UPI000671237B|nr:B3/4 domain-containing protein [Bacillus sp. FJAT-27916]KMY43368.1 tRNA synthetase subunit beta [Bacillus sp. FJAT-27916]